VQLIDVQLLVTHIVGFLIVLGLLKKFAWGPVLSFLDQRRDGIKAQFDEIDSEKLKVDTLREEYEGHLRNIEIERREAIQAAVSEGKDAAARIKERAEEERKQRLERAKEEIHLVEENAKETLRKRMVDISLRAAEKVLQEDLDDSKHQDLLTRFVKDLDSVQHKRAN
jgi:F-type H+-transporting ATPase subunit b